MKERDIVMYKGRRVSIHSVVRSDGGEPFAAYVVDESVLSMRFDDEIRARLEAERVPWTDLAPLEEGS